MNVDYQFDPSSFPNINETRPSGLSSTSINWNIPSYSYFWKLNTWVKSKCNWQGLGCISGCFNIFPFRISRIPSLFFSQFGEQEDIPEKVVFIFLRERSNGLNLSAQLKTFILTTWSTGNWNKVDSFINTIMKKEERIRQSQLMLQVDVALINDFILCRRLAVAFIPRVPLG